MAQRRNGTIKPIVEKPFRQRPDQVRGSDNDDFQTATDDYDTTEDDHDDDANDKGSFPRDDKDDYTDSTGEDTTTALIVRNGPILDRKRYSSDRQSQINKLNRIPSNMARKPHSIIDIPENTSRANRPAIGPTASAGQGVHSGVR